MPPPTWKPKGRNVCVTCLRFTKPFPYASVVLKGWGGGGTDTMTTPIIMMVNHLLRKG